MFVGIWPIVIYSFKPINICAFCIQNIVVFLESIWETIPNCCTTCSAANESKRTTCLLKETKTKNIWNRTKEQIPILCCFQKPVPSSRRMKESLVNKPSMKCKKNNRNYQQPQYHVIVRMIWWTDELTPQHLVMVHTQPCVVINPQTSVNSFKTKDIPAIYMLHKNDSVFVR